MQFILSIVWILNDVRKPYSWAFISINPNYTLFPHATKLCLNTMRGKQQDNIQRSSVNVENKKLQHFYFINRIKHG